MYIICGKYFILYNFFLKFSKIALWNFPFFFRPGIPIKILLTFLVKSSEFIKPSCQKKQMAMEFLNNFDRNYSLNGKNIGNRHFLNAFRLKLVNQLYFYHANKKTGRQCSGPANKILSPPSYIDCMMKSVLIFVRDR